MRDIKRPPRVSDAAKPRATHSLVSIDAIIDDIGRKALEAAQQAEKLEAEKRDADKTAKITPAKAAIGLAKKTFP